MIYFVIPLLLLILAVVYFWQGENRLVEINRYRLSVGKHRLGQTVRMVHITDLHAAPWADPSYLIPVVDKVNELKPDYVVITGDFATYFREYIPGLVKVLSRLSPSFMTYAVLGNHDYWVDDGYLTGCLEEAGIKVLSNKSVPPAREGDPVFLGISDPYTNHDNLEKALSEIKDKSYKILLSHTPDIMPEAEKKGIDLVLAGHTHGGQVRLPILGAIYVPSAFGVKYDMGWFKNNKTRMFVNRGLGGIFPAIRLFCKREMGLIELIPEEGNCRLSGKLLMRI